MENKYQGYKNPLTGKRFRVVGAPIVKKDARALVTGKPVYTDDLAPKDCLIVKVLRSPHAHALVEEIESEGIVLLQEGADRTGRGVLGAWVAAQVAGMYPAVALQVAAEMRQEGVQGK